MCSPPLGRDAEGMNTHTASERVLRVRDLKKAWAGRSVLQGVSFDVHAGEIFGILGANGTGKTTTVEILQGLVGRDGGEIDLLGLDPATDAGQLRSIVGSQLQTAQLPERLRVGEAVEQFAHLAGDVVDWRELMIDWDLDSIARQPFRSLSGGQRQRLFLALALVNRPRIVFLDELTQGLDPAARRETWGLIERVRDLGTTVVLVSHYMDEIERLCERVGVLRDGRMDLIDTPARIVANHDTESTCRFTIDTGHDTGLVDALAGLPEVLDVNARGANYQVRGRPKAPVIIAATLSARHHAPSDFTVVRPSLEDVFVNLTGAAQ